MSCPKCNNPIRKNGVVCSNCGRSWHNNCAGLKHQGRQARHMSWVCNGCAFAVVGQNHAQQQHQDDDDGGTDYYYVPTPAEMTLLQKCDTLERSSRKMTHKLGRLTIENDERRNQTTELSGEVHRLKDMTKNQFAAIRKLKIRQEVQQQELFCKNVEIQNLFERADQDLVAAVVKLLALQGKTVTAEDIDSVVRLPFGSAAIRAKPVVVVFKERALRDDVLRARTQVGVRWSDLAAALGLSPDDLASPQEQGSSSSASPSSIQQEMTYVNPHLTPYFRRLLNLSKRVCKDIGVRFCWYHHCKVLIRYPEDSSNALVVETMEDLQQLSRFGTRAQQVVERKLAEELAFRMKSAEKNGFKAAGQSGFNRRRKN